MTKIRLALSLATAAALSAGVALAAEAETQGIHNVGKLQYTNKGGYTVSVSLRWKDTPDGKEQRLSCYDLHGPGVSGSRPCNREVGEQTVIDLSNPSDEVDRKPAEGAEVWLNIDIRSGGNPSCRKSNAKFYYEAGSSKTARFSTAGTTKNNNNCTYDGGG